MLVCTVTGYRKNCGNETGGLSYIYQFDPNDYDFTQAAAGPSGCLPAYSVLALRTGATLPDAGLFEVHFNDDEAEHKQTQAVNGCNTSWNHELTFQLSPNSQTLTCFLMALDRASCCGCHGYFLVYNDGRVFVIGEKYVNTVLQPKFKIKQNGTETTSGKKMEDFNGANVKLLGSYTRPAFEIEGGIATIEPFFS